MSDSSLYMQIEGVKGAVTQKGYEGWIDVSQGGISFYNNADFRSTSNVQGGRMAHSEATYVKFTDCASLDLFQKIANGEAIPEIKVVQVVRQSGEATAALTVTYSDCVITSYQMQHQGSADLASVPEQLSFAYGKIQFETSLPDESGKATKQGPVGWNMISAEKL